MNDCTDPFARWQLTNVINAAGTMTTLGASRVPAAVIDAVVGILPEFVFIDELQGRASAVIAAATGAEAGCVTACSAAALTQACAAAITGCDLAAIEALPDCPGRQNRVAVQAGHAINFGAPVEQTIRLSGAQPVRIGSAALCEIYHLESALDTGLAAGVYVVSHHTVREGELPLDLFIEVCHGAGVPVIVDMASEQDLRGPIELGADLVIYSGHKFMAATTSGIVAGKADRVRGVYLQHRGIGRTMKVGKEGVVGAMAALELWSARSPELAARTEQQHRALWLRALGDTPGLALCEHRDWTGNPITRMRVSVNAREAGLYAWELSTRLAARNPAVVVRDDLVEHGYFFLDPCNLNRAEAQSVAAAIVDECRRARSNADGCRQSWSAHKRARATAPLTFPPAR